MKGPTEKHFEGIYANPRLMHALGLVVGCICHVQVKNGTIFEGVLKTFSHKADFVLEMARKVDIKKLDTINGAVSIPTIAASDDMSEKLIFKFEDVVTINVCNVDSDFATRENFTDTAISKFNGQIPLEKELEPWDGGSASTEALPELGTGEEAANGWDPNDMFRTNEEKYGVKSSFDSNMTDYTMPLVKQNTEEYKQQELRASKIAQEIESSLHHKNRAALENGDEEDRFSAVMRPPESNNNNFRTQNYRNRKPQNMRNLRNSPAPQYMNRHSQVFHRVSTTPVSAVNHSQGGIYKMVNSATSSPSVNTISPRPTPTSTPPTPRQHHPPISQLSHPTATSPPHYKQMSANEASGCVAKSTPPTTPPSSQDEGHKTNGELDKTDVKYSPKPQRPQNLPSAANKEMRDAVANQQHANKNIEKKKEAEKKTTVQKAREDKTEDLKRFHARFKLSEEPKESHGKDGSPKVDIPSSVNTATPLPPKHYNRLKDDDRKSDSNRTTPDNPKGSSLNPNAKEFVLNPNAKTFTPKNVSMQNVLPHSMQPPPRLHTQSPIITVPTPPMMPAIAPAVFNVAPHYVVSATPVSMPMAATPFTPASSVNQAPRFRKKAEYGFDRELNQYEDVIFSAMPLSLQRHDMSQNMHVQAATGQPILAQNAQFFQYAPTPGMIHPPGPPQQLTYATAQMYSLMPRVLTSQSLGMVPTSTAYGDGPQMPTHVYVHPGTPSIQHSAPSTPQSQTPNLHPAPSPVHQTPVTGGHGQPPTVTGHPGNAPTPQSLMYAHSHMAAQHSLHANHATSNPGHPFLSYPGGAQPIVLLPQAPHGPHPGSFASLQSHMQNPGTHGGGPAHGLPHTPMAMIPTSAGMVHNQTAITSGHYVPHSQGSRPRPQRWAYKSMK